MAQARGINNLSDNSPHHIGLCRPWGAQSFYSSEIWRGVLEHIRGHTNWTFEEIMDWIDKRALSAWQGDGLFCCDINSDYAKIIQKRAQQLRIPVVSTQPNRLISAWSNVDADQEMVGEWAADHLLERGLQNFGFCGFTGAEFSDQRRQAFVRRIQQAGFPCSVYAAKPPAGYRQTAAITRWLTTLPKPVGILGDPYVRGREILTACARQKWMVPEDVAIITVNGGREDVEQLESPLLSYVKLNPYRAGTEAAALLVRLMSGTWVATGVTLRVAPLGVESRPSTDILAISDPHVAKALRYIWQHACEGIRVADILQTVPHSRRTFEQQFKQWVGRTPHEEIERVQMRHAKELLSSTTLSLKQIAARIGIPHAQYFGERFRQKTGLTPAKYRSSQAAK